VRRRVNCQAYQKAVWGRRRQAGYTGEKPSPPTALITWPRDELFQDSIPGALRPMIVGRECTWSWRPRLVFRGATSSTDFRDTNRIRAFEAADTQNL